MFILQIMIVLFATKVAGQLTARMGQPSVVGKILIGIIIGPAVLGWIEESEWITVFSQIGVLLLMFLAGLETNLKDLQSHQKGALYVAFGGIIVPIVFSYFGAIVFDFSNVEAIFLGLLLSATSVSISVQVLRELGWFNSKEGSTLLGAAIVDDIVVVLLIAVALSVLTGTDANLALVFSKKVIFFILLFIAAKWLIPKWLHLFTKFRVTEPVLSAGLIICYGFAYGAEYFGVTGIIGTFFAGLAIAQTTYKKEIEHKLEPIAYGVFVPFFFVSIGLTVSFEGIQHQLIFLIVFSVLAVVSKLIGSGIGAKLAGFSPRSLLAIGSGMVSRGEVALILATLGLSGGLLPKDYYTSIVLVIIITTIVTPLLLKKSLGVRENV